ncbi:MAG: ubiquitin-conjugating enzyme E2 [Candidatus Methanomethylophilaceae archaeon]
MGLPPQVLKRRIATELRDCSRYLGSDFEFDPEKVEFPIRIDMHLSKVVGYEAPDKPITEHDFYIILSSEYGLQRPEVRWKSKIFHPNIMDPSDGGYVCTKMLDKWDFSTPLLTFLKGVEILVSEPNPMNPFGTDSCMAAARYFADDTPRFDARIRYGDV